MFDLNNYLLAGATLLTGAGIGAIFEDVPNFFTNLFKNHLFKYVALVLLVWQSGQDMRVAMISSAVFMFVVYGIKYVEDLQKFRRTFIEVL